jgi:predicted metalloendopeptidase
VYDLHKQHGSTFKDFSSFKHEADKRFNDIRSQLITKAEVTKVKDIKKSLKTYALYEDFKSLYNKIVPPVHKLELEIIDIYKNFEQVRQIVSRQDESLALKANKV